MMGIVQVRLIYRFALAVLALLARPSTSSTKPALGPALLCDLLYGVYDLSQAKSRLP
jgi:hypothetical protein